MWGGWPICTSHSSTVPGQRPSRTGRGVLTRCDNATDLGALCSHQRHIKGLRTTESQFQRRCPTFTEHAEERYVNAGVVPSTVNVLKWVVFEEPSALFLLGLVHVMIGHLDWSLARPCTSIVTPVRGDRFWCVGCNSFQRISTLPGKKSVFFTHNFCGIWLCGRAHTQHYGSVTANSKQQATRRAPYVPR